jgi:hypothetical protein
MEEVGASTQPRLGEHYRTYLGLVFPPEEKIVISGEHIFSGVVSTSSSIFTADRFSDFSDGCYSSGPSIYTTNSVVPEGVLHKMGMIS